MSERAASADVDLGALGLERGGHVLLQHALRSIEVGSRLAIHGSDAALSTHLAAWARARGHAFEAASAGPAAPPATARSAASPPAARGAASGAPLVGWLTRGSADLGRRHGAERAGRADGSLEGAVAERPDPHWGLAARGAAVEAGGPPWRFALDSKDQLWADEAADLYAQALAAQWDPARAVPWDAPLDHDDLLEDALVTVLTYLIENETAALLVPARFAAQVHPHFREVQQLLAIQAADEARHIEVFTRRARLRRTELGLSTVGGQLSLRTLVEEPDFEQASLLLGVLGEGSFVNLLWFLHTHAPDACTRAIMKLAAQDEARHVAFAVAHLARHARLDPTLLERLAASIERRHDTLRETSGLNEEVFDALVLLAAGSLAPADLERGHTAVVDLSTQMHAGRRQRLRLLGFPPDRADALSGLHTRNFM